jgi:hypothetical protein
MEPGMNAFILSANASVCSTIVRGHAPVFSAAMGGQIAVRRHRRAHHGLNFPWQEHMAFLFSLCSQATTVVRV